MPRKSAVAPAPGAASRSARIANARPVDAAPAAAKARAAKTPAGAARQAPEPAARPARKAPAAAAVRAAVKGAARTLAAPPARKAAPRARSGAPAAPAAAPRASGRTPSGPARPTLVRDSFTMPEQEYAVLLEVKQACLRAGIDVKKSELLRIGVALLGQLDVGALQGVLAALPQLKTGRPSGKG